jgi:hypothetical protein
MPNLNGEQRARIRQTLLRAFPRPEQMEMLLDRLDKNLPAIARTGAYETDLQRVVEAAETGSWLGDLLAKAIVQNPGSTELAELASDYAAWITAPLLTPSPPGITSYTYPWESLLEGYRERSPALLRNVGDFLLYYLGTPAEPAPFGGRSEDLQRLQAWLEDPASPLYAALVEPPGIGKSALLAHWVAELAIARPNDLWVAYYPVSIRYSTNTEPDIYGGLAARLARLHGEPPPGVNEASLHAVYRDYLEHPVPEGVTLLVVLDGLDEKAGSAFSETLAPAYPPPHLRFLVAARQLAADRSPTAWLRRLGWRSRIVKLFELEHLDPGGLAEVLQTMGDPLEHLAGDPEVVERLFALSQGDPLLVRLYVDALLDQGDQAAWLQPADLQDLVPGLEAYFQQWFKDQARLWGSEAPFHEPLVKGLVDLCATALGPLKRDDLHELGQGLFASGEQIEAAAGYFTRFLTGDGLERGYSFNHPRLGVYFARRQTSKERAELRGRFLAYGERVLHGLNSGQLLPEEASEYVLRYYGAHLEQGRSRTPPEAYAALLSDGWRRAWDALEGTPDGFLADAQRAWDAARPTALGQVVRAALCFASVASLSGNLPPELLARAVDTGVLSLAQAEVYARRKATPASKSAALLQLARLEHVDQEIQQTLTVEAVQAAQAEPDPKLAVEAMILLLPHLPIEDRTMLVEAALGRLSEIKLPRTFASLLAGIAPHLADTQFARAITLAARLADPDARNRALFGMAPYFPPDLQEQCYTPAFDALKPTTSGYDLVDYFLPGAANMPEKFLPRVLAYIEDMGEYYEYAQAILLAAYASRVGPEQQQKFLERAIFLAGDIDEAYRKAPVLSQIAHNLPPEKARPVILECLQIIPQIEEDYQKGKVLADLAPILPQDLHAQLLSLLGEMLDQEPISQVITAYAPGFSKEEVIWCIRETNFLKDPYYAVRARVSLAQFLSDPDARHEFTGLGAVVSQIADLAERADGFARVSRHLAGHARIHAVQAAIDTAQAAGEKGYIWQKLAPNLPVESFPRVLEIALTFQREFTRSYVLTKLAPYLPASLYPGVLAAAREFNTFHKSDIYQAYAAFLSDSELLEAYQDTETMQDYPSLQAITIAALRLCMPEMLRPDLSAHPLNHIAHLASIIHAAEDLDAILQAHPFLNPGVQAKLIGVLVPHLPDALLPRALELATQIERSYWQLAALEVVCRFYPLPALEEVYAAILRTEEEVWASAALAALAERAPLPLLADMYRDQIRDQTIRESSSELLTAYARRWEVLCIELESNEYSELLKVFSEVQHFSRESTLSVIEAFAPVIARLGGEQAVLDCYQAILDVTTWWP